MRSTEILPRIAWIGLAPIGLFFPLVSPASIEASGICG
jgi:hypothetical protein